MTKPSDHTNKTFGRLTGVCLAPRSPTMGTMWLWRCSCGTEKILATTNVVHGTTKSCGCLNSESASRRSRTHGLTGTKAYWAWQAMRARCDPQGKDRAHYHDRGICVHPGWESDFAAFFAHIGEPPSLKHTLDRIDGTRGYEPGNVRWATWVEQRANRGDSHGIKADLGDTIGSTLVKHGLSRSTFHKRVQAGWSRIDAATTPPFATPKESAWNTQTSSSKP